MGSAMGNQSLVFDNASTIGGISSGFMDSPHAVLMTDLPQGMNDDALKSVIGAYGMITSHKFLPPMPTGAQAVINFSTPEEAKWCVEHLNGNIPVGLSAPIKCMFKNP